MPSRGTSSRLARLTIAGLVLTTTIAACKKKEEKVEKPKPTIVGTENIVVASNGTVTTGPSISGTLAPEVSATIRAQVSGSVLSTFAEAGQRVAKGQVLGQLDASALQAALVSGRSAVASAQNSLDIATRDLQRQRTLLEAGAVAPRDVEAAERTNTSAKAQLEAAKAQLAMAAKNVENTRIVAPFSGIVSKRAVNAGDVVQPGGELFTVVDPSSMRLDASVSSNQLSSVRVGTNVVFTVNGYPGREFNGRVTRVSPAVDPTTRQVMITAEIPNAGNALVAGLYADGRLSSSSERGIAVPVAAVDTRMQRPAVVRIRKGKVERSDVQLGARDATTETVIITSGVSVGDTLLVAAAQAITPGTEVQVQKAPNDARPLTSGQGGGSSR